MVMEVAMVVVVYTCGLKNVLEIVEKVKKFYIFGKGRKKKNVLFGQSKDVSTLLRVHANDQGMFYMRTADVCCVDMTIVVVSTMRGFISIFIQQRDAS